MLSWFDMYSGKDYCIYPLGDAALEVRLGDRIDPQTHARVVALWHSLQQHPLPLQIDLIPAYCVLDLLFERHELGPDGLLSLLPALIARIESIEVGESGCSAPISIPVCYEGDYAPDLVEVSDRLRLSPEQLIEIHTQSIYTIYMLGFLPGFPYLGILPESIRLSRKEQPQPVLAGTVALAGAQTGIYPTDSPGGWWRIGRTPIRLFDPQRARPCLFEVGDRIAFRAVDAATYSRIERSSTTDSVQLIREKGGWI